MLLPLSGKAFAETGTPEPSPTATPTNQPFYKTPTPGPTKQITCDFQSVPNGWGTVTPSVGWFSACSKCPQVPKTPVPTNSLLYDPRMPTSTPWVTATPYPVQATVTIRNDGGHGYFTEFDHLYGPLAIGYSPYAITDQTNFFFKAGQFDYTVQVDFSGFKNDTWQASELIVSLTNPAYMSTPLKVEITGTVNTVQTGDVDVSWNSWLYPGEPSKDIFKKAPFTGGYSGKVTVHFSGICDADLYHECTVKLIVQNKTGSGSTMWTGWTIWKGAKPSQSYCSSVSGEYNGAEGVLDTDLGQVIALPKITLGWKRCAQIMPFTLDFSWIPGISGAGLGEATQWPGLEICRQPVYFGKLNLLGLEIDLDLVAFGMASLFLGRRILFRS